MAKFEGLLVRFAKNVVAAFRESLRLYKNEKYGSGFKVLPCKKFKLRKLFPKFVKPFVKI